MNSVNEFIKALKKILNEVGGEAYLVGGFVRDKLINFKNKPKDLDIIYDGEVSKLLAALESQDYNFLHLEGNKEIYEYKDINSTFHIEKLKGKDIQEYLSCKDFSINAICIKLVENKVIDPFKGRKAIECRIIQHVNNNSIEEDPVRILTGIRLCIQYGMHFNLETEKKIVEIASRIKNCDKERVFNEFMNLIKIDSEGKAFEFLDNYDVLKNMFPYMEELKTVGKCKYHAEDAFTHMNLTYEAFKDIIKGRIELEKFNLDDLENYIGNFKIKEYVSIACFLHDIGKFKCYKEKENNVSFLGHEKEGAKLVNIICKDMKFPQKAAELIEELVDAHMCPLGIFTEDQNEKMEASYKFFEKYKEYVPFILILSFCDNYATYDFSDENNKKQEFKKFIQDMLIEYKTYKSSLKK
jgi:poly(A) polymerase